MHIKNDEYKRMILVKMEICIIIRMGNDSILSAILCELTCLLSRMLKIFLKTYRD